MDLGRRDEIEGWTRRIDGDMLAAVGLPPEDRPRIYVCGPTPSVLPDRDVIGSAGAGASRASSRPG